MQCTMRVPRLCGVAGTIAGPHGMHYSASISAPIMRAFLAFISHHRSICDGGGVRPRAPRSGDRSRPSGHIGTLMATFEFS